MEEVEKVVQELPLQKMPHADDLQLNSKKACKNQMIPILFKHL